MKLNISDLEQTEKYIRGELQQSEIEQLWMRFLEEPELFKYFDTQIHIISLAEDVKAGRESSPI